MQGNKLLSLSETELTILKRLAPEGEQININVADQEYGLGTMVELCGKGWLSLLCATVLIDDAYYCLSPEGREQLPKVF